MVNEYLDGYEVLQTLTGENISKEMRYLLYYYHTTKEYYNTDALIFESFFGVNDGEMIKRLHEADINTLYIKDNSTALMHTILTLIDDGFVLEGVVQVEKIKYHESELEPALKFIKK